jgi:hypothetical protein
MVKSVPSLIVPDFVNALFHERTTFGHRPRANILEPSKSRFNVYRFFSPQLLRLHEESSLVNCGIPQDVVQIDMNRVLASLEYYQISLGGSYGPHRSTSRRHGLMLAKHSSGMATISGQ